jgi:hypothetical protein
VVRESRCEGEASQRAWSWRLNLGRGGSSLAPAVGAENASRNGRHSSKLHPQLAQVDVAHVTRIEVPARVRASGSSV